MDLRLPPLLNQAALFTRAATFGDTADLYYHSPSNRIAANYSPQTSGLMEKSKVHQQRGSALMRMRATHERAVLAWPSSGGTTHIPSIPRLI